MLSLQTLAHFSALRSESSLSCPNRGKRRAEPESMPTAEGKICADADSSSTSSTTPCVFDQLQPKPQSMCPAPTLLDPFAPYDESDEQPFKHRRRSLSQSTTSGTQRFSLVQLRPVSEPDLETLDIIAGAIDDHAELGEVTEEQPSVDGRPMQSNEEAIAVSTQRIAQMVECMNLRAAPEPRYAGALPAELFLDDDELRPAAQLREFAAQWPELESDLICRRPTAPYRGQKAVCCPQKKHMSRGLCVAHYSQFARILHKPKKTTTTLQ